MRFDRRAKKPFHHRAAQVLVRHISQMRYASLPFTSFALLKYIRANRLLQESEKARDEGRAYDYTNQMSAYDLLVSLIWSASFLNISRRDCTLH